MSRIISLAIVILLAGCGGVEGEIKSVLDDFCRSRAEGEYTHYLNATAGDLLLAALRDPGTRLRMQTQGSNLAAQGIVLIETYLASLEIEPSKTRALARYLEKFGQDLRTWAVHHEARLEYIDQAWRVVSDRVLQTQ